MSYPNSPIPHVLCTSEWVLWFDGQISSAVNHLCAFLWSLSTGAVTTKPNLSVEVDLPLLLSCSLTMGADEVLHQVRWYDRHRTLLLAYQQRSPVAVSHQEPGVHLTTSHQNSSSITIKKVRHDDEGCYRCVFDVYPVGGQEAVTCVHVTG